ncbi:hypothetical protein U1Q18_030102 [Sarracenia purpurea var. burkii]
MSSHLTRTSATIFDDLRTDRRHLQAPATSSGLRKRTKLIASCDSSPIDFSVPSNQPRAPSAAQERYVQHHLCTCAVLRLHLRRCPQHLRR